MQLEAFLEHKNTSLQEVMATAKERGKLSDDDIVIIVGSLSEGLATLKSDIDLILITERDASEISDKKNIAWMIDECLVDMEIMPLQEVRQLTDRFQAWCEGGWDKTFSAGFSQDERKLLHRYLNGVFLEDGDGVKRRKIVTYDAAQLAKLKHHSARHVGRTIQVDMVGHELNQDYRSLAYAAHELLGHAIDSLLAAHYLTNPLVKWRSRLMDRMAGTGISQLNENYEGQSLSALVWYLYEMPSCEPQAITTKVTEVTHFCRLMFLYAELTLVYPEALSKFHRIRSHAGVSEEEKIGQRLPRLKLDVDFHIDDDSIYVGRLNEPGAAIELNPIEFSLLLQFDGVTDMKSAISNVDHGRNDVYIPGALAGLVETCRSSGFTTDRRSGSRSNEDQVV
jgi:hypothetical protein